MSNIKSEMKKGVGINFIATYTQLFSNIFISAILARLLSPREFGVVAVVMVFTTFFNLLSDLGVGPAVIQDKTLDEKDISNLFIFTGIIGIASGIGFYFFSYFISYFYQNSEYINIGKLLSLSIFFYTINIIPLALNRKRKKFKLVGIINILTTLISGVIAIYLAYKGFSYYSIVYRTIFNSFFIFLFNLIYSKIKIYFSFDFSSVKKIFSFSSFQFLFNFVNYFSRNLDTILIGKFMGDTSLGLYDRAYKLMLYPVQYLTHVITPVLHPILSEYQSDKDLIYNSYKKVVKILGLIGIPISVFSFFSASEIINVLYGSGWEKSIPVFKILACTIFVQMMLSSTGSIFQAVGKTNKLFLSGVLSAISMVSGILFGVFIGKIEYVGIGILIAFYINFFQGFYILIHSVLEKSLFKFLFELKNLVIIAIIMILPFLFIEINIESSLLSLVLKFIIGLISYVIGLIITKEHKFFKSLK